MLATISRIKSIHCSCSEGYIRVCVIVKLTTAMNYQHIIIHKERVYLDWHTSTNTFKTL